MSLEDRVGHLEVASAQLRTEVGAIKLSVADVGSDVKRLLDREARRPTPVTGATVLMTLGSIGAAAGVIWWLIGNAPAVQDLTRRMDRLDDAQVGRVTTLERKVETLTGWAPARVDRAR